MHDAYEAAAAEAGWQTQQASRVPWADVPEANKATMRAAVTALLGWLDTTETVQIMDMTGTVETIEVPPHRHRRVTVLRTEWQDGNKVRVWACDCGHELT